MMLTPQETELVGDWVLVDGRVFSDEVCKRIQALVHDSLKHIATDSSGWKRLYLDPHDGRYWELTHPKGELQAGGPPKLSIIDPASAATKYGLRTDETYP